MRPTLAPLQGNQLVVTAMVDKPMPKLREAVSDVPQGICDVVDRCLQKHKEYRYKDARELLEKEREIYREEIRNPPPPAPGRALRSSVPAISGVLPPEVG